MKHKLLMLFHATECPLRRITLRFPIYFLMHVFCIPLHSWVPENRGIGAKVSNVNSTPQTKGRVACMLMLCHMSWISKFTLCQRATLGRGNPHSWEESTCKWCTYWTLSALSSGNDQSNGKCICCYCFHAVVVVGCMKREM